MAPLTQLLIDVRAEREGPVPFVGTVAGFVVVGAGIERVEREKPTVSNPSPGRGRFARLALVSPGDWFKTFVGRRIEGPSGGAWYGWPVPLWAIPPPGQPDRIAG